MLQRRHCIVPYQYNNDIFIYWWFGIDSLVYHTPHATSTAHHTTSTTHTTTITSSTTTINQKSGQTRRQNFQMRTISLSSQFSCRSEASLQHRPLCKTNSSVRLSSQHCMASHICRSFVHVFFNFFCKGGGHCRMYS